MGQVGDRWEYARSVPTPGKVCKDCVAEAVEQGQRAENGRVVRTDRPAPHPGPRCATHHRAFTKRRKRAAGETRTRRVYGLTEGDYGRLYEAQGGLCAICRRATGASKALAVDHDHACAAGHPPKQGCRECVRGLLCSPCNRMLGHLRDDPAAMERAAQYLRIPPAVVVLRRV